VNNWALRGIECLRQREVGSWSLTGRKVTDVYYVGFMFEEITGCDVTVLHS
jgi:hypothetical protein